MRVLIHHTDFIMVLPFHFGFFLSSVGLHSDSTSPGGFGGGTN